MYTANPACTFSEVIWAQHKGRPFTPDLLITQPAADAHGLQLKPDQYFPSKSRNGNTWHKEMQQTRSTCIFSMQPLKCWFIGAGPRSVLLAEILELQRAGYFELQKILSVNHLVWLRLGILLSSGSWVVPKPPSNQYQALLGSSMLSQGCTHWLK